MDSQISFLSKEYKIWLSLFILMHKLASMINFKLASLLFVLFLGFLLHGCPFSTSYPMNIFFFLKFYWSIVNLQGCDNLFLTAKWPSHTYTHIHSLWLYSYIVVTEYWAEFSVLYSTSLLANCSIYLRCTCANPKPQSIPSTGPLW